MQSILVSSFSFLLAQILDWHCDCHYGKGDVEKSLSVTGGHADPAADDFTYPLSFDIRDLVPLEDVMKSSNLGLMGGLLS